MDTTTYKAKVRKDGSLSLSKRAREILGIQQGDEIEINIVLPIEKANLPRGRSSSQRGRRERIDRYLQERVQRAEIAQETVNLAQKALEAMKNAMPFLDAPDVSTSVNRQVLYTWDKVEHHLLLEVFPDGSAELFSRNRLTNALWGHDYSVNENLPQDVIARIRQAFEEC